MLNMMCVNKEEEFQKLFELFYLFGFFYLFLSMVFEYLNEMTIKKDTKVLELKDENNDCKYR